MAVVFDPLSGKSYYVPQAPDGNEMRPPEKTQQAEELDTGRWDSGHSLWSVTFEQGEGLGVVLNARA